MEAVWRVTGALLLRAGGVAVADWPPPFRFAVPGSDADVRTFEPFIAAGFTDREAWEALFTDEYRLEVFRVVYGNRKGPLKRRRRQGVLL